jgi:ethanolamine utilization protein EutJ
LIIPTNCPWIEEAEMALSPALPNGWSLEQYLSCAESVILPRHRSESAPAGEILAPGKLRIGVDLGTAYMMIAVLDETGCPLAGEWQFAQVVRDGLVVDFMGAVDLLRGMKARVERRIGRELTHASSGYPPGVPLADARAKGNVVEAAGLETTGLLDEPTAANNVLRLHEGAIVDVGGGTTGIAVLKDGRVVYTADEATGGTHFSLVVAGSRNIELEDAEALKIDPREQPRLMPHVRPVMEKVASIVLRHVKGWNIPSITMVGGCSAFLGMAHVVQEVSGIPTSVPEHPMFITPLGMALHAPAR